MTSKEKAIELVSKMKPYAYCYLGSGMLTNEYDFDTAVTFSKELALIAVAEIISLDMLIDEETYVEKPSYTNYWRDVRDEIRKLTSDDIKTNEVATSLFATVILNQPKK